MAKATNGPLDECSETVKNPIVVVQESGRSFRINNPEKIKVRKIQVDGCLPIEGERCDYAFEIGDGPDCVIYLELKGKDIPKAYSQLCATLAYLAGTHGTLKKICHIVASRVPKIGPEIQTFKAQMQKKHRAILIIGTNKVDIDITQDPYRN